MWTLKAVLHVHTRYLPLLLLLGFFIIFLIFFNQKHTNFLFGTYTLDPEIAPNNTDHHFYFFFSEFSPILLLLFICKCAYFHIWKCVLDPETSAPISPPVVCIIPPFFLKFPLFYWYFSFVNAHISIFRNVPWTLKTVPQHHHQPSPFFS